MKYLFYVLFIFFLCWLNLKSGSSGWIDAGPLQFLAGDVQGLEKSVLFDIRMPALITGMIAGAGLAIAGLVMQVLFQNQLAGPGIMGVSSGGSFTVSLAILAGIGSYSAIAFLSMIGSVSVLVVIMIASLRFKSNTTVLILGLMIGYIMSAAISILQFSAEADRLQQFVFWTMGGFHSTSWHDIGWLASVVISSGLIIIFLNKKLDVMLLGEDQMTDLGLSISNWRMIFLMLTGVIVGVVTAYCGPLAFIGLASPHIARLFTRSDIHTVMIPHTLMIGMIVCLISLYLVNAPWISIQLPLNAVLSIFGAPVVIWLLIRRQEFSSN